MGKVRELTSTHEALRGCLAVHTSEGFKVYVNHTLAARLSPGSLGNVYLETSVTGGASGIE